MFRQFPFMVEKIGKKMQINRKKEGKGGMGRGEARREKGQEGEKGRKKDHLVHSSEKILSTPS